MIINRIYLTVATLFFTMMASFLLSLPAKAQGDGAGSLILSVAGVANDRVEEVGNDEEDSKINIGGGILIEAGVNDNFGIETGALVINRQYDVEKGNVRIVEEVTRVHIPILARLWMTDFISIAAGPFIGLKVGDEETKLEIGGEEVASLETSADKDTEFGLDGALTLNLAVNDKTGIFIEGRYSLLLEQEDDEEANEISALAGLKFDL